MPLEATTQTYRNPTDNEHSDDRHPLNAPAVILKWKDESTRQHPRNLLSADSHTQATLSDAGDMIHTGALAMFTEPLSEKRNISNSCTPIKTR